MEATKVFTDSSGFSIREGEMWQIDPGEKPTKKGQFTWKVALIKAPELPNPTENHTGLIVTMAFQANDGWGFEQLSYPEKEIIGLALIQMHDEGNYVIGEWAWFSTWLEEDVE